MAGLSRPGQPKLLRDYPIRRSAETVRQRIALTWYRHRAAENASSEFVRLHGLGKEKALDQIKAQFPRGEEIGPGFDAFGHGAYAKSIGEFKDSATHRLLQAVVRATGNEISIDFDFDKGKIAELHEQRPFRAEIVDRYSYIVESKPLGNVFCQRQIVNELTAIYFDDKTFERRMIGHLVSQILDCHRVLKERDRKIDGNLDMSVFGDEIAPIADRSGDYKL